MPSASSALQFVLILGLWTELVILYPASLQVTTSVCEGPRRHDIPPSFCPNLSASVSLPIDCCTMSFDVGVLTARLCHVIVCQVYISSIPYFSH